MRLRTTLLSVVAALAVVAVASSSSSSPTPSSLTLASSSVPKLHASRWSHELLQPVFDPAVAWSGQTVFVCGGKDGHTRDTECQVAQAGASTAAWHTVKLPSALHGAADTAAAALSNGASFLHGGAVGSVVTGAAVLLDASSAMRNDDADPFVALPDGPKVFGHAAFEHTASAAHAHQSLACVWGGEADAKLLVNDVHCLLLSSRHWLPAHAVVQTGDVPSPRKWFGYAATRQGDGPATLYISAGVDAAGHALNDVYRASLASPQTLVWQRLPDVPFTRRSGHAMFVFHSWVWMHGGEAIDTADALDDLWAFPHVPPSQMPPAAVQSQLSGPSARLGHRVVPDADQHAQHLVMAGGVDWNHSSGANMLIDADVWLLRAA